MTETPIKHSSNQNEKGFISSLRNKMFVYFGLVFIITIAAILSAETYGIPFSNFIGEYYQHQTEVFRNLSLVADLKKERLLLWVEERKNDTAVLAGSPFIKSAITDIQSFIKESHAGGINGNELWKSLQNQNKYQSLLKHMNLFKNTYQVYKAIQIADASNGNVIFSTRRSDLGVNISKKDYFLHPVNSDEIFVDFEKASDRTNTNLIIAITIKAISTLKDSEDQTIVVMVMVINPDDFFNPFLHTGDGLGKTGEVLLVNNESKILTALKHATSDGSIPTLLDYKITDEPASFAAGGGEGMIKSLDYRGEPVLAAYRHIAINSEIGWGMVVKCDLAEIFAPMRQKIISSSLIGFMGILLIIALISIVAANLSRPINILSNTVKQIERGNLGLRVPITASGEVGFLAKSFNSMIQRIENWHKELEREVRIRTEKLDDSNLQLKKEIEDHKRTLMTLRESEERYSLAQMAANLGSWDWNIQSGDAYWSKQIETMFGFERGNFEGTYEAFLRCVHSEDRQYVADSVKACIEKNQYYAIEHRIVWPDGTIRWMSETGNVIRDDMGKAYRMLGMMQDITERKRAEDKLEKQQWQLVQADKMISLGTLVAGVAHEINNPNNFIMLNSPVLQEAWQSILPILDRYYRDNGDFSLGGLPYSDTREDINQLFSGIQEGAQRIKNIVNRLKDFARPDTSARQQLVDLNDVTKSAVVLVGNMIKNATNNFSVDYGKNLPQFKGNFQRLEQVIVNLIQNACQAIQDKTKGINISTSYNSASDNILVIVQDEGQGIPTKDLPHIMDPFYTTKRFEGGTGLGLSISYNIVQEYGGKIVAQSDSEKGSMFTVHLPITKQIKEYTILVVDDDSQFRKMLIQALLKERPYVINEAASGIEACIKLGIFQPDLLILDVQMPDMDGVEVYKKIKSEAELSDMKVIIITGNPDSQKIKELTELGITTVCQKPVRLKEFIELIDNILR